MAVSTTVTKYGVYVTLASISLYIFKIELFGVPVTLLEGVLYFTLALCIVSHLQTKNLQTSLKRIFHKIHDYIIPVSLLFIALFVSTIISDHQLHALGMIKSWFIAPILFMLLFLDTIRTKQDIQHALFFLSLSAWPIMLWGIYEYVLGIGMVLPGRLDSYYDSPNFVAMYVVPLALLVGTPLITDCVKIKHVAFKKVRTYYTLIFLGASFVTILLTKSFGGYMALLGGIVLLITFVPRFSLKKFITLSLIGIAAIGVLFIYQQKTHVDEYWQFNSLDTRIHIWKNSLAMTAIHPFFGIGMGDFQTDYKLFLDTIHRDDRPIEQEILRPHNIVLGFWLETGLLGVVMFLWILTYFYARKPYLPALIAMSALLIHGLVDTPYFKNDLSFLFWIIVAMSLIYSQKAVKTRLNLTNKLKRDNI